MRDEQLKILEMVAQGKITPEEGANLLNALGKEEQPPGDARWLHVRVSEPDTGKVRVDLRIPARWDGKLLKWANKFGAEADLNAVHEVISSQEPGKVMEIDTEDGNRVEIWMEG